MGRTQLYDTDDVEDSERRDSIERQDLALLEDMPVADLLDRLEHLLRAQPSVDVPLPPDIHVDSRNSLPVEPFANLFEHLQDALRPYAGTEIIHWPSQKGIPVCRRPDGSLYIVHLFSGRRRSDDCHDWVDRLKGEYFPDIDIILLESMAICFVAMGSMLSYLACCCCGIGHSSAIRPALRDLVGCKTFASSGWA